MSLWTLWTTTGVDETDADTMRLVVSEVTDITTFKSIQYFYQHAALHTSTAAFMSSENHCVVVYVIDSGKKQSLPNTKLLT